MAAQHKNSVQSPFSADEDREVIALVGKLCSKVTEMEVQRQSLVAQLRSQLEEDDVTSALMTNPGIDAEVVISVFHFFRTFEITNALGLIRLDFYH